MYRDSSRWHQQHSRDREEVAGTTGRAGLDSFPKPHPQQGDGPAGPRSNPHRSGGGTLQHDGQRVQAMAVDKVGAGGTMQIFLGRALGS